MTSSAQKLQFPVDWNYKIITEKDYPQVETEICRVLRRFDIETAPTPGRESATGKYLSYRLTVSFESLEDMHALSAALAQAPGVKFLI